MAQRFPFIPTLMAALALGTLALAGLGPGASPAAARGVSSAGQRAAMAGEYTITDLGPLPGGTSSLAYAINASGQVAGSASDTAGLLHAVIWHNGTITDLGTLPGGYYAHPAAINDAGQVVGAGTVDGPIHWHGFLWQNGTMTDLSPLISAGGIDTSGQIVGAIDGGHAVLVSGGTQTNLWDTGYVAGATDINDAGQIVGLGESPPNGEFASSRHALLYEGGAQRDLGYLDPSDTIAEAHAINAAGQIVGYTGRAYPAGRAFLWQDGVMTELSQLPGHSPGGGHVANAINDLGQIVGTGYRHAVIWQDGEITDLHPFLPPDWTESQALGINNNGQIVGYGNASGGLYHAFLLTPANACAVGASAAGTAAPALVVAATLQTGGHVSWSANAAPGLAGTPVRGAVVRIGCASTTTDAGGNYSLAIDRPGSGGIEGEVTLPIFQHTWASAKVRATFTAQNVATQAPVSTFGKTISLSLSPTHDDASPVAVDNVRFGQDGFAITGASVKLFSAPNDAPLTVDVSYKKSTGEFKVHASSGTYKWGTQSVQLTTADYQSPADSLTIAGKVNLALGGLALQNLAVSGERTGDEVNLVASGAAVAYGTTFTFSSISLVKQGDNTSFHLVGIAQLPSQKNPVTFDVLVRDGDTTLDLDVNQFDFNGSTVSARLHYDSQTGLRVVGSGQTQIDGKPVTVTIDSAINPNKQTVDAKADLAFGTQGIATGVALHYDGKVATLEGGGSLTWKAKPCLSFGTGGTDENTITLGVTVKSTSEVAVTGSGKFALPCEYGVGAVQLDVSYSGPYAAAQLKLPLKLNGTPRVDCTFRVENNAGEGRFILNVSIPINGKALPFIGSGAAVQPAVQAQALDPLVRILLTDPFGLDSGFDQAAGTTLAEIPDVTYLGVIDGVDAFTVPAFIGAYQVTLISNSDTAVTLNVGGVPLNVAVPVGHPVTVAAGATIGAGGAVTFVAKVVPTYADVPTSDVAYEAITQLAARGIIRGYEDGTFGPGDHTLRAQMAALIARAMGWDGEDWATSFPDRGPVDAALWRNVGTLAHYNVARGYPDGNGGFYYDPTGEVLHAQVISFITRAMVTTGRWQQQAADPALYGGILTGSGHEADVATYVHYAAALPDLPTSGGFAAWDQPSTRAWFARALWQALQTAP